MSHHIHRQVEADYSKVDQRVSTDGYIGVEACPPVLRTCGEMSTLHGCTGDQEAHHQQLAVRHPLFQGTSLILSYWKS